MRKAADKLALENVPTLEGMTGPQIYQRHKNLLRDDAAMARVELVHQWRKARLRM